MLKNGQTYFKNLAAANAKILKVHLTQQIFTCSNLKIKTPKRRQRRRSGVCIANFERTSHLFLVFLLLTLKRYMLAGNLLGTFYIITVCFAIF